MLLNKNLKRCGDKKTTDAKLHKIIKPQTYPKADIKCVKIIDSSLSHGKDIDETQLCSQQLMAYIIISTAFTLNYLAAIVPV